jgi:hypothetical protein
LEWLSSKVVVRSKSELEQTTRSNLIQSRLREMINACKILIGKPEGKRSLRRPRRAWEGNIKMDIKGIGCGLDYCVNLQILEFE